MKHRFFDLLLPALALCASFAASRAVAGSDSLSADEIARRTLRADAFAWEGAKTRVRMVLSSPDGKRLERSIEVLARRDKGLLQTMVRFLLPADLAGTAFLMREQQGGASEQYIYLSGLKRTRRVVGKEREGSFMGSDFTYADMQRVDRAHAKSFKQPDEDLNGSAVHVIVSEIDPKTELQYSKIQTWVRKSDLVPLRTRFFDKQGKLLKTLYTRRVREIDGRPVVMEARMQNEQTGHATDLVIDSLEPGADLADELFTPAGLEHF